MRITLWLSHHSLKMEENVTIQHLPIQHSTSTAKIAPALVKAINSIQPASKDGSNPHFKSKYTTISSLIEAARPHLAENDITIMQNQGGITERRTMVLSTRILHTSGEWYETYFESDVKNADIHVLMSTMTYCRRGGLAGALNMSQEDDDGNVASQAKHIKSIDLEPLLIEISESMQNDDLKSVAKKIRSLKCNNADLATLKKAWSEQKAAIVAAEKAEAQ